LIAEKQIDYFNVEQYMISMIAAVARNGVIGKDNRLPWNLPADLAYFKKVTMGHAVVMGRRTFESIGRPLPGRCNIILTGDRNYHPENCIIMHSVEEVLEYGKDRDIFIIGGAKVYKSFMNHAGMLYITLIDRDFEGDAYFPEIDKSQWTVVSQTKWGKDESSGYRYRYIVYRKNSGVFDIDTPLANSLH